MSEEFQESDIIFSDQSVYNRKVKHLKPINVEKRTRPMEKTSSPVRIPAKTLRRTEWDTAEEEEEEDKTPPHVIMERRMKEKIAFSVCTHKGRDLSRHRNSVLRMTGFLEA
ncbi:hypothetical protein AALP_AA6G125600 [Arabis alpina]|uniref:Uncharacterized protein n=1 Tax=Arabis alpina TaxID=50452 RepID=A0A087GNT8_ARAAL|nr:hypothetical protein AALP_AA6G125600 [Arabis alpina]